MHSMIKPALAAALLAGSLCLAAPAAFAGWDDGGSKDFWAGQSSTPAAPLTSRRRNEYRAYSEPVAGQGTVAPQKDPPSYNRAMGTAADQ